MRISTLLAGCAFAALLPATAFAQSEPVQPPTAEQPETPANAEPEAGATNVGEVIVTARRREEALRDVPIAVSAISGDTLERQQIRQVREVAALAPGVNINSDSAGRAFVSIRGVGTTLIDTVQPGVGIFIDGVYQPNTSYLNSPLVDVERVEILRGPQGTLFGNNTLGGAINVVQRQPGDDLRIRANATYAGPDDYYALSGSVSGPIVEGRLQGRLGVAFHSRDGFQENTLTGGELNPLEQQSIAGTLRWTASEDAVLTLNVNVDRVEGASTPYIGVAGPTDYTEDGPLNVDNRADITYTGVSLRGDFNLDWARTDVTTVLAYNGRDLENLSDGDFGPVDFIRSSGFNDLDTYTGEVRFDTQWSDRVSTLAGVFVSDYYTTTATTSRIIPLGVTQLATGTSETNYRALFGTVFFELDPTLDLSIGLRYDEQNVDASTATTAAVYEAQEWQPRITLSKDWSDTFMTYGSIARGFRGGGQNGPGAPNLIYEGDSVWTYELGAKYQSPDRRFSLDAAVFYNDYSNFIGQNSLAPSTINPNTFVAINLNTGDVESYGVEAEAIWRPTDQLRLNAAVTLLHARITDDTPYERVTGVSTSSDRLIFTPDWNFNVGASYTIPMGLNALVLDANLIGKGDRLGSSLDPAVAPELEAYFITNASAAYRTGNWEVALFSTNLFNEEYIESYIDRSLLVRAGLGSIARNLAYPGERRRVGVRLNYRY